MRYVLGIDQGGSKTHAMLTDETGAVLGMGKSYGACHSISGLAYAMTAVEEAAAEAMRQGGLEKKELTVVAAGMTGVDWDDEAGLLQNALCQRFTDAKVVVVNDCIIAMRAGTTRENSGIICVGSGLNCAVKKGHEVFTYGYYIPDEYQGGASLGRRTIQAVFDAEMGLIPQTALRALLLSYFKLDSVDSLLYHHVNHLLTSEQYLYLPILLEQAAAANDAVALTIWERYAKTLASFLVARARKMEILHEEIDVVLSGSILKCRLPEFQETLRGEILKQLPGANIVAAEFEPVVGAALLGLDQLSEPLPEGVYHNLEESAGRFPLKRLVGEPPMNSPAAVCV